MNMTISELREKLKSVPLAGTYPRSEFQKFGLGGGDTLTVPDTHSVSVMLNYQCLDPYSDAQRVKVLGLYLTVYVDHQRCESFVVRDPAKLDAALTRAIRKANRQCQHKYGEEVSVAECREKGIYHAGRCWHVYKCEKCGEYRGFDSSD